MERCILKSKRGEVYISVGAKMKEVDVFHTKCLYRRSKSPLFKLVSSFFPHSQEEKEGDWVKGLNTPPTYICFNVLTRGRVEDELITDSFSSAFSCMNRDNILVQPNAKRENLKAWKWIEIRLISCPPDEKGGKRRALYKTTNPCEIFWRKSSG